jgi:hypothetical protein
LSRIAGWLIPLTLLVLGTAGPAGAATVAVNVVPSLDLESSSENAAVGLLVPGWGDTTSREAALAALTSGRLEHALLGGDPPAVIETSGDPDTEPEGCCDVRILLELPPPGTRENDARYPIAIEGAGYEGILSSPSTQIPGLVTIADIAPTVLRLRGKEIPDGVTGSELSWRADTRAAATLRELDDRLEQTRGARLEATAAYAALLIVLAVVALLVRSPIAGRGALLVLPAAATASLALSLVDITSWWAFAAVTVVLAVGGAAAARSRTAMGAALAGVLGFYYAGLLWGGDAASLSLLGPNPDAGGRFYGLANELETILVGTALVGAALLWDRWGIGALIALGGLGLVTIAPGRLGASVTGAVVLIIGLAVLAIDLEGRRGLVVVALAAAAGAAALLLAAPRHFSDISPGRWLDRLELSGRLSVDTLSTILLVFALSIPILVAIAALYPSLRAQLEQGDAAALLALLVATGVSVLVNDAPAGVLPHGAAWCLAMTAFGLTGSQARRSGASYRLAPVCVGLPSLRSRR